MQEFPCTQCGKCCMYVNLFPQTQALDRGDGICKNYEVNTKLCKVYDHRPEICNIHFQYTHKFADKMSWDEFVQMNLKVCELLPEKQNIPIMFIEE